MISWEGGYAQCRFASLTRLFGNMDFKRYGKKEATFFISIQMVDQPPSRNIQGRISRQDLCAKSCLMLDLVLMN